MKNNTTPLLYLVAILIVFQISCGDTATTSTTQDEQTTTIGQSSVVDDESQRNVVQIAASSTDHTTLVGAVEAAGLVDVLSNAGPFTVFAPINKAFEDLPEGTVESLLKPENKNKLQDILEYHVFVGVIQEHMLSDGRKLNQVNLKNATLSKKGEDNYINDAKIIGNVRAANGIVYIIDKVLLPE